MFPACDLVEFGGVALNHFQLLFTPCTLFLNSSSMIQGNVVKTLQCHFLILTYYQRLPCFKSFLRGPILFSKVLEFIFNLVLRFTSLLVYRTSFRKETSLEEPEAMHSSNIVPPPSQGSWNAVICKAISAQYVALCWSSLQEKQPTYATYFLSQDDLWKLYTCRTCWICQTAWNVCGALNSSAFLTHFALAIHELLKTLVLRIWPQAT